MSPSGSIISDVKPLNLIEERDKFLADPTYNPQFKYPRQIDPNELIIWGRPRREFYEHAVQMINYWKEEGQDSSAASFSPTVDEAFIREQVTAFNERYKLEKPVEVVFSETTVARCMLKNNSLIIRSNLNYSQNTFRDVLRHELETHYLRKHNNALQPWGAESFPDQVFRRTEEGLANLHTFLLRQKKLLYKSYRMYIATYYAQTGSFVDVFNKMRALDNSVEISFLLALRTKRGLTDTKHPGGLTKDVTYLEGSVGVWRWIMNPQHDVRDLYFGRISIEQIEELKTIAVTNGLFYPSFFEDMNEYHQHIADIGEKNQFDQLAKHLD